jgi:sortase A
MTKSRARRRSRIRRWFEYLLLLAGIVGVGLWIASNAVPAVWQYWENRVFDREVATRSAPSPPSATPAPSPPSSTIQTNSLIGRITIPRLHLRTIVREGAGSYTLSLAVGHIPGTALPWQKGNVGVAGHRDTLFRGMGKLRKNDVIRFDTHDASYVD